MFKPLPPLHWREEACVKDLLRTLVERSPQCNSRDSQGDRHGPSNPTSEGDLFSLDRYPFVPCDDHGTVAKHCANSIAKVAT